MKFVLNKTKSVGWFNSNCGAWSKRDDFGKKMKEYINVDIYGNCGTLKCAGNQCDEKLASYYFYLSFENSLCIDYASEKLFRPLGLAIPIVFNGVKNLDFFCPPHSYINANDYDTVEDLVNYMKYLIANPKEYLKYLWWTKHYRVRHYFTDIYVYCDLCQKLNDEEYMSQQHVYPDMKKWFFDGACNQTAHIQF